MERLALVTFALLVACSSASEPAPPTRVAPAPVVPAPAPVAPAAPRPPPADWQLSITDGTLSVGHGLRAWQLSVPADASAALVELTSDGASRGVWLATGDEARLYALGSEPTPPQIASWVTHEGGGIAGFSTTSARLLDLDDDGTLELVLRHSHHDDTGTRERNEVLARTSGAFAPSELRAPPERTFYLNGGPIEDAIRALRGPHANVLALVSPTLLSAGAPGSSGLGAREGPPIGATYGAVSYVEEDSGLALEAHIVRAWPETTVLASQAVGHLREAFTDDACRTRVRLGPFCRVLPANDGSRTWFVALVWAEDAARRATVLRWDGAALTTLREPIELDRCDTPARDLSIAAGADGVPTFEPILLADEQRAAW